MLLCLKQKIKIMEEKMTQKKTPSKKDESAKKGKKCVYQCIVCPKCNGYGGHDIAQACPVCDNAGYIYLTGTK